MSTEGSNKPKAIACKIYEKRDGVFVVESTDQRLSEFINKEHDSLAELYNAIDKLSDLHECGLFVFIDISTKELKQ